MLLTLAWCLCYGLIKVFVKLWREAYVNVRSMPWKLAWKLLYPADLLIYIRIAGDCQQKCVRGIYKERPFYAFSA